MNLKKILTGLIFLFNVADLFALQKFSSISIFGDSFSSDTVYNADAAGQRGSGSNWPVYLSSTALETNGCYSNYAQGGQKTEKILGDIQNFISSTSLDSAGIYTVWGGANDNNGYAGNIAEGVSLLQQARAGYVLVLNLYNCPYLGNDVPIAFNADLYSRLQNISSRNIIQADIYALFNELSANPSLYGYGDQPVFTDSLHGSDWSNQIIAQYCQSLINAPQIISILPETAFSALETHHASFNALAADNLLPLEKFYYFADILGGSSDLDETENSVSANIDSTSFILGMEYGLKNSLTIGGAFSYGLHEGSLGSEGDYSLSTAIISFDAKWQWYRFLGDISLTQGTYTFDDINRKIILGSHTVTASGDTSADSFGIMAHFYYSVYKTEHFEMLPFFGINSEKLSMEGYREEGNASTSMHFSSFDREIQLLFYGLRAQYKSTTSLGPIDYFFNASWNQDSKNDVYSVNAGVNNFADSDFNMTGYEPEGSFFILEIGAKGNISETFALNLSWIHRAGDQTSGDYIQTGISF